MSKKSLFITLVSILSLIGIFLEWSEASVGAKVVYHFNGIDSNQGKVSLILTVLIGICAILSNFLKKQSKLLNVSILIFSVSNLVLLLINIFNLKNIINQVDRLKELGASASIGIGIILSLFSTLVILT